MNVIKAWIERHFSNPQVVILTVILLLGFAVIYFFGRMLVPLFAGLVVAYLLDGLIKPLVRRRVPRIAAVVMVFLLFMLLLLFTIFWLVPLLIRQVTQLVQQLPTMIGAAQQLLLQLPENYPRLISEEQVYELIAAIRREVTGMAQKLLSFSVASVMGLITLLVYLFIVPLLVFFFLKDKERLLDWFASFMPRDRWLAMRVWEDVNAQIANYIRGKTWEIIIVWASTALTFTLFDLQYAVLLGFIVGLSVLIPYVGAAVATIPIALVAYFQWGFASEFVWILVAYTIIQTIDGNVLAPLLLSEVVNIHPVAVIASILVFGGLWGFWGIFFAIPLATLVQAILRAWPSVPAGATPDDTAPAG
ncbi:MAG: AI-2E family transporter [Desulfatitalea sp.]|nr:AI-2E family transporter [Desulfatitalea sp.]